MLLGCQSALVSGIGATVGSVESHAWPTQLCSATSQLCDPGKRPHFSQPELLHVKTGRTRRPSPHREDCGWNETRPCWSGTGRYGWLLTIIIIIICGSLRELCISLHPDTVLEGEWWKKAVLYNSKHPRTLKTEKVDKARRSHLCRVVFLLPHIKKKKNNVYRRNKILCM